MIFYFSGTGNSRYVASSLGRLLDERVVSIPVTDGFPRENEGKTLGFVFPVYSWAVPPNVTEFVRSLPESLWESVRKAGTDVWCVMTCGDETGMAPEMFGRLLAEKGISLKSLWSVTMPNNYVLLPGFDVDSKETERKKLREAPGRIEDIARGISERKETRDFVRGPMPRIKTGLVYPLFRRWGIFPKKWRSTFACVGCGICARRCPYGNIAMKDGRPSWGNNCCSCLACYHSCPRHAVEYGSATSSKGQYFLPEGEMP